MFLYLNNKWTLRSIVIIKNLKFRTITKIDNKKISSIETGILFIKEERLNLDPKITLDQIAADIKVTKHDFSQYLNEHLKKSFSVFINELRVEKAKELLDSHQQYSVEGIGQESGFNSKSTFYAAFKKVTGMTPAEYRKLEKT